MRVLLFYFSLSFALALTFISPVRAQGANGCCRFVTRGGSTSGRVTRCDNLTQDQCHTLKAQSSFFAGWVCDFEAQRCVSSLPPRTATRTQPSTPTAIRTATNTATQTSTVTPTGATPTRTPTKTLTPTNTPIPRGCCQLDNVSGSRVPICGNDINETSCLHDFSGDAHFCADCVCSSHSGSGFDTAAGSCVPRPPTATPTRTPTVTATATATPPLGCCELANIRGVGNTVCGNQLTQISCMNDFQGDPTFFANFVCSSHTASGFDLNPGNCVPRTPAPTPMATSTPSSGCCQIDNFTGLDHPICGNNVSRASCLNDFGTQVTFCPECKCTSHSGDGFDLGDGVCQPPPRPRHRPEPHQPHGPHH